MAAAKEELTPSAHAAKVVGHGPTGWLEEQHVKPGKKRDNDREKEKERGERYLKLKLRRRWGYEDE